MAGNADKKGNVGNARECRSAFPTGYRKTMTELK